MYIYVYEEGRGKRKHPRKPKKVPREKNRNKTNPPEDTRGHQSAEQTNKCIKANLMNIRYSNNEYQGPRADAHARHRRRQCSNKCKPDEYQI